MKRLPSIDLKLITNSLYMGRGGGQVFSVLAFYSDDPSSNPAEVYNFSVKLILKRMKINKKEAGVGPLKKTSLYIGFICPQFDS